jgi:hypothetical protein
MRLLLNVVLKLFAIQCKCMLEVDLCLSLR